MNILQLIASESFITVNKELIKKVGLEEAIILGELASEFDYWQKQKGLTPDGYFFSTVENIEDKTTLSDHKQRKALNKLRELELVDVSIRGLPAKRYIKLNEENLFKLFENKFLKNLTTSSKEISELDSEKLQGNNNIINNNIINNNINNISEETSSSENNDSRESTEDIIVTEKEPKKSGRKSRKDQFLEYVDSLDYQPETKDILRKWIFAQGLKGNVTVDQLKDKLQYIWSIHDDEALVRESIYNSYLSNYFAFFPVKQDKPSSPTFTPQTYKTPENTKISPATGGLITRPRLSQRPEDRF